MKVLVTLETKIMATENSSLPSKKLIAFQNSQIENTYISQYYSFYYIFDDITDITLTWWS